MNDDFDIDWLGVNGAIFITITLLFIFFVVPVTMIILIINALTG